MSAKSFPLVVKCIVEDGLWTDENGLPSKSAPKYGELYIAICEIVINGNSFYRLEGFSFEDEWDSTGFVIIDDGIDKLMEEISIKEEIYV